MNCIGDFLSEIDGSNLLSAQGCEGCDDFRNLLRKFSGWDENERRSCLAGLPSLHELEYPINIFPSPYIQLCGEEQLLESEKGRRLSFLSRFLLELREA